MADDCGEEYAGHIQVPDFDPPLGLLAAEQRAAVSSFHASVLSLPSFPSSQRAWFTQFTALRFLRARKWDAAAAAAMLSATLAWRDAFRPDLLRADDHADQLRFGFMFHRRGDCDRYLRPVVYLRVYSKHAYDEHPPQRRLSFMIHTVERVNALIARELARPYGVEKQIWVVHCGGYSMGKNGSVGFARQLLDVLQNHYPETLGMLVLLDAPLLFTSSWKVLSPFLDQATCRKVRFVSGEAEKEKVVAEFWDDKSKFYFNGERGFDGEEYLNEVRGEEEERLGKYEGKGGGENKMIMKKKEKEKREKNGKGKKAEVPEEEESE